MSWWMSKDDAAVRKVTREEGRKRGPVRITVFDHGGQRMDEMGRAKVVETQEGQGGERGQSESGIAFVPVLSCVSSSSQRRGEKIRGAVHKI